MKELFEKKDKRSDLQKEYDEAVKMLKTFIPGSDDYKAQLEVVERINTMLMEQEDRKKKVSPDVILSCALGIIQVGAILGHERLHNVTSKALGFVMKGRIK